jgi:hypothetical protein
VLEKTNDGPGDLDGMESKEKIEKLEQYKAELSLWRKRATP